MEQKRAAPPMEIVTIRLPVDIRDALDEVAGRRARQQPGYNRSDVIRAALVEHLRAVDGAGT